MDESPEHRNVSWGFFLIRVSKGKKKDPNGLFKSTQCGQNAISDKSLFELTL